LLFASGVGNPDRLVWGAIPEGLSASAQGRHLCRTAKAAAYLPVLELLHAYFKIVAEDDPRKRCGARSDSY
jgi:hypothetical protein